MVDEAAGAADGVVMVGSVKGSVEQLAEFAHVGDDRARFRVGQQGWIGEELLEGWWPGSKVDGSSDGIVETGNPALEPAEQAAGGLWGGVGQLSRQAVHIAESAPVDVVDAELEDQFGQGRGQAPAAVMAVMPMDGGGGGGVAGGAGQRGGGPGEVAGGEIAGDEVQVMLAAFQVVG